MEVSIALYEVISKIDSLWGRSSFKIKAIRLQKVHVTQLLTFHRNYKQVAKGKVVVKAKGKIPMTAKDGNQNYPKGHSNEESVCVRTLKTILRVQKIKFPSNCTSIRVLLKLLKDTNSNSEPN